MGKNSSDGEAVQIAFILVPRFNMVALTTTIEPLRVANYLSEGMLYDWVFYSPDGGAVAASNGMEVATQPLPKGLSGLDMAIVCASWNAEQYENPELFAWLRRHDRLGVTIGAMDIATYILARAGLLSGHRAAVLWYCARAFAERFPEVEVEERLFTADRNRITIAGGTAGMDAMLQDIARRFGGALAQEVSEHTLHGPIRSGDAPQRSLPTAREEILHPVVRTAIHHMEGNIEEPLAIPDIAKAAGVSQRKLERIFRKVAGCSASRYYQALRLQHALVLLNNTDLSIREISLASGYASLSHFAKSFAKKYGKRPRDCRESWPQSDPQPHWPGVLVSLGENRPPVHGKGF
ncbi:MAG: GlxA family transcriptional regulator [Pseudomonadota bacterium]